MKQEMKMEAVKTIENYRNNPVIMEFVKNEALEKIASEIREVTGSGTTAKAVELLSYKNKKIQDKIDKYIAAGLVGCYMASFC